MKRLSHLGNSNLKLGSLLTFDINLGSLPVVRKIEYVFQRLVIKPPLLITAKTRIGDDLEVIWISTRLLQVTDVIQYKAHV